MAMDFDEMLASINPKAASLGRGGKGTPEQTATEAPEAPEASRTPLLDSAAKRFSTPPPTPSSKVTKGAGAAKGAPSSGGLPAPRQARREPVAAEAEVLPGIPSTLTLPGASPTVAKPAALPAPTALPTPVAVPEGAVRLPSSRKARGKALTSPRPSKVSALTARDMCILDYVALAGMVTVQHIHEAIAQAFPETVETSYDEDGTPHEVTLNSLGAIRKRVSVLAKHGWLAWEHETAYGLHGVLKSTHKGIGVTEYVGELKPASQRVGTRSESLAHTLLVAGMMARFRGGMYADLGFPGDDGQIVTETQMRIALGLHEEEAERASKWFTPAYDEGVEWYEAQDLVLRGNDKWKLPDFSVTMQPEGETSYALAVEVECAPKTLARYRDMLGAYLGAFEHGMTPRSVMIIVGNVSPYSEPSERIVRSLNKVLAEYEAQGYNTQSVYITEADMELATPWRGAEYEAQLRRMRGDD